MKLFGICSAYQQNLIHVVEPLRSRLRLVTEKCDRRIQGLWAAKQAEIAAVGREKQQLQKDIEAMRGRGESMQAVVHDTVFVNWCIFQFFIHSYYLFGK